MESRLVLILTNPKAGPRSGLPAIEKLCQELEWLDFEVRAESNVKKLAEDAQIALADGTLWGVVAAGGDGTAALVANSTAPGTPIAVLPLGTENLLAKFLELPTDPASIAQIIAEGEIVRLDAGRANDRLFLIMVGCGFDADVVRRLHRDREGHIQHWSYAKPILDAIRSYDYPEIRIYCLDPDDNEGSPHVDSQPSIVARWAFIANVPRYAGGLQLTPHAIGDDGLLDVCTFKHGSLWNGLMYLGGVALGQHESWSDCTIRRMKRLRIESDAEVPYQLDGDPGGVLPIEIQVLPERLTLFVPSGWSHQKKDF